MAEQVEQAEASRVAVPPAIVASWRRSRSHGVDAMRPALPRRIPAPELQARLAASHQLVDAARPHLEWLSAHFAAIRHVVYVTDADGIVLASLGDPDWQEGFGLLPGHDWSEAEMGTNGAGTALAADTPVVVAGREHYVVAFHDCTCVAAPVHDPSGRLIGAIDFSTSARDGKAERSGLIAYAALMVERDLIHEQSQEERRRVSLLAVELAAREEALRQTADRLQVILDNAPVLIYLVDTTNRFLSANKAWLRLSGLREASVIGRSLYDVFDAESAAQFEANNRIVLEARESRTIEEVHDGRTYLSVKVPVLDAQGRAYAICGMSVDITERKLAEAMLRESEERFRMMADFLPLIVWVHGPDGEQQFVNQTFCEFFQVTREDMRLGRWRALLHPDDELAYSAEFERCVRDRRPFHAEARVRRGDGQWRWIESWGRPRFSADGDFLGFVGSSADVTERKKIEHRLLESEGALRDADRKKNEFIAMLGHELRNPLGAIRNATHIMRVVPGDTRTALEIVDRQLEHLVRLVDDLLDVSRITLGKLTVVPELLDVRTVITNAIDATRLAMQTAGHRFRVEGMDRPAFVEGDRVRLAQVVVNLLNNAIRYTPAGGHVRLSLAVDEDTAAIVVEDSGIGLTPQELAVVFEPFVQADNGRAYQGGLGIGLALVKKLVDMHGGGVEAESAGKGHGTRFTVRLPTRARPV